jgi:hypothetical protein
MRANLEDVFKKYKIQTFVNKIKDHLKEYKGKIIFKDPSSNKNEIDGEFSEFDMTIKCFLDTSSTYWIGVLAHEYSHFLQCINESEYWIDFQIKVSSINNLNNLFQNKKSLQKISKSNRLKLSQSIIKMELDCDKSAIALINKYKLPVDKKEYRSKANIVLYKYLYWGEYGIWPSITDKETGKIADWKSLGLSRLSSEDGYKNIDNMPKRLFDIFTKNNY